jgi:hypothetical protein
VLFAAAVVATVGSCTLKQPTPPNTTMSPVPAGPPLSPLEQALTQIRADGSWSKDTALAAFAAAFGELPGVVTPQGVRHGVESSGIALRMLLRYWAEITPEQRSAAKRIFGTALDGIVASRTRPAASRDLFAAPGSPAPVNSLGAPPSAEAPYQIVLERAISDIAAHVGHKPRIRPRVELDDVQVGGNYAEAICNVDVPYGPFERCVVHIYPLGRALAVDSVEMKAMLAHESWHVYQMSVLDFRQYTSSAPWIIEGEAQWVGETIAGGTTLEPTQRHWSEYVLRPGPTQELFRRTYDAIGFYSHLDDAGVNVWLALEPVFNVGTDNGRAFDAAVGTSNAVSTWGASYFLDGKPIAAFDMIKTPGRPHGDVRYPAQKITLGDGDSKPVGVTMPAKVAFADIQVTTDVLRVDVTGHALAGDLGASSSTYQLDAGMPSKTFCVKPPCKCPDGTSPLEKLTDLGAASRLSVSGDGHIASQAQVTGLSMESLCKPAPPKGRGLWQGTWKSTKYPIGGTFELDISITSTKLDGEVAIANSDCVASGHVQGTVNAGTVKFGTVASGPGVIWAGTIDGNTMSGTYSAAGCGDDHGTWSARH